MNAEWAFTPVLRCIMGNGRNQVEGVELNNQTTESSSYKRYIIITLLTDIYKYISIVEQFFK